MNPKFNPFFVPSLVQFNNVFLTDIPFPNVFYKNNKSIVLDNVEYPRSYNLVEDKENKEHCEKVSESKNKETTKEIIEMMKMMKNDTNNFDIHLNSRFLSKIPVDLNNNALHSNLLNCFLENVKEEGENGMLLNPKPSDSNRVLQQKIPITPKLNKVTRTQPESPAFSDRGMFLSPDPQPPPQNFITPVKNLRSFPVQHNVGSSEQKKLSDYIPEKSNLEVQKLKEIVNNVFIFRSQNRDNMVISFLMVKTCLMEVLQAKKNEILQSVPLEELIHLTTILGGELKKIYELIFCSGSKKSVVDVVETNQENANYFRTGLTIVLILLELMTTKVLFKINKKILSEEIIENFLLFVKKSFRKYFFVVTLYFENSKKPIPVKSKDDFSSFFINEDDDNDDKNFSKVHLYQKASMLLNSCMKLISVFIGQHFNLKDEFIFDIIDISISSFFISNSGQIHQIQLQSINCLSKIFSKNFLKRKHIFDLILVNVLKLSTKKKKNKKSYYLKEKKKYIFNFSALIMKLIQSCAGGIEKRNRNEEIDEPLTPSTPFSPFSPFSSQNDDDDDPFKTPFSKQEITMEQLSAHYDRAVTCAKFFINNLLTRCLEDNFDGDNRVILDYFIDDLLECILLPSWPSADLMLRVFFESITRIYLSNNEKKKIDDKFRSKGVEMLGKIAAKILFLYKKKNKVNIELLYNNLKENGYNRNMDVNKFYSRLKTKGPFDVVQLLIHNYLSSEMKNCENYSLEFTILEWVFHDDNSDTKFNFYKDLWMNNPDNCLKVFDFNTFFQLNLEMVITFGKKKVYSTLNLLNQIIGSILGSTKDRTVKIRQQAIKSIEMLISINPFLMNQQNFQKVIIERSKDEKIKVRESVINLVGGFLKLKPNISNECFNSYINMIILRLKDGGKSCKKKAIKLLGEIFCLFDTIKEEEELNSGKVMLKEEQKCFICCELCELISSGKEDENICNFVIKTFESIWFNFKNGNKDKRIINEKVLQIISVVAMKKINILTVDVEIKDYWLTKLLKKNYSQKNLKIYEIMVECVINHIIYLEEKYSKNMKMNQKGRDSFNSCLCLLFIFTNLFPKILVGSANTFKDYLSLNSVFYQQKQFEGFYYLSRIFILIFPHLPVQNDNFNKTLFYNLVQIVGKSNFNSLVTFEYSSETFESCIKCFCFFSLKTNEFRTLTQVIDKLFGIVKARPIPRAIKTLGYISQHFEFPKHNLNFTSGLKNGSVLKQIIRRFINIFNLKTIEETVKSSIIEALGCILIIAPALYLEKPFSNVLKEAFNTQDNYELKKSAIKLMIKYLVHEEAILQNKSLESPSKIRELTNKEKRNVSISMGIIPPYIDAILKFISSIDFELRYVTLELIGIILKQGLYFPSVIAPFVLAMEGDIVEKNSNLAHKINLNNFETHHLDFLNNSPEGVKRCYLLLYKNKLFNEKRGLSVLYNSIISKNTRSKKNYFFDSLLKFIIDTKDVIFIDFLVKFFKIIRIDFKEDLCHIIYKIDFLIDKDATNVKNLKDKEEKKMEDALVAIKIISLIDLKTFLMTAYNINYSDMEGYRDSSPNQNYKKPVQKHFVQVEDFKQTLIDFEGKEYNKIYKTFKKMFQRHVNNSCKLSQMRKKRRKRKTKTKPKKKPVPKKKKVNTRKTKAVRSRKRKRENLEGFIVEDDDEEDEEDEEEGEDDDEEEIIEEQPRTKRRKVKEPVKKEGRKRKRKNYDDDDDYDDYEDDEQDEQPKKKRRR